jgi:HK97 family phage major capsid protein
MADKKELQIKLGNLQTEIDGIGKKAKDEERKISPEERQLIEAKFNEQDTLLSEIKEIEFNENLNKRSKDFGRPAKTVDLDPEEDKKSFRADKGKYQFGRLIQDAVRGVKSGGYSEELRNHQARADREDAEFRAISGLGEKVPSDGGFLLTTDYSTDLIANSYATGQLVSKCRKLPISTQSGAIEIPGIDETSRADGYRQGGVQMYWTDEADEKTGSKPKFRKIRLEPKKITGLVWLTDELLGDVAALQSYVTGLYQEELGFKLDDAILNGTGVGQPLGIAHSGALISIAAEGAQAADTVISQNIENMYMRMMSKSKSNAGWYINNDVWPQIYRLSHAVGTGGTSMFMLPGSFPDAPRGALLGRPVMDIEQCETLGDAGDIYFLDLSHYILTDKGAMQSAISMHVRFIYDETVLRFVYRVDGQPDVNSTLTPFKGTNTVSPFVRIAART